MELMELRAAHMCQAKQSRRTSGVQILYRHGRLHMYRSGTDLLLRRRRSLFVVTSGLVKVAYTDPFGGLQEYFLASGALADTCCLLPCCISYSQLGITDNEKHNWGTEFGGIWLEKAESAVPIPPGSGKASWPLQQCTCCVKRALLSLGCICGKKA